MFRIPDKTLPAFIDLKKVLTHWNTLFIYVLKNQNIPPETIYLIKTLYKNNTARIIMDRSNPYYELKQVGCNAGLIINPAKTFDQPWGNRIKMG